MREFTWKLWQFISIKWIQTSKLSKERHKRHSAESLSNDEVLRHFDLLKQSFVEFQLAEVLTPFQHRPNISKLLRSFFSVKTAKNFKRRSPHNLPIIFATNWAIVATFLLNWRLELVRHETISFHLMTDNEPVRQTSSKPISSSHLSWSIRVIAGLRRAKLLTEHAIRMIIGARCRFHARSLVQRVKPISCHVCFYQFKGKHLN